MKAHQSNIAHWAIVAAFAIAMAWVESAVVFYLRTMMDRIEPHQPDPLPVISGFASVELPRELSACTKARSLYFPRCEQTATGTAKSNSQNAPGCDVGLGTSQLSALF